METFSHTLKQLIELNKPDLASFFSRGKVFINYDYSQSRLSLEVPGYLFGSMDLTRLLNSDDTIHYVDNDNFLQQGLTCTQYRLRLVQEFKSMLMDESSEVYKFIHRCFYNPERNETREYYYDLKDFSDSKRKKSGHCLGISSDSLESTFFTLEHHKDKDIISFCTHDYNNLFQYVLNTQYKHETINSFISQIVQVLVQYHDTVQKLMDIIPYLMNVNVFLYGEEKGSQSVFHNFRELQNFFAQLIYESKQNFSNVERITLTTKSVELDQYNTQLGHGQALWVGFFNSSQEGERKRNSSRADHYILHRMTEWTPYASRPELENG